MTPSSKRVPPRAATSRWDQAPHAGAAVTILCGVCLVAGAGTAQAGINVWTSHGPGGVYVDALAIDPTTPTTLYAGTENGRVFKSTDGGGTWNAAHAGLSSGYPVRALAIDSTAPTTLYAGTYDWLYKSTDGGSTWSATGLTNTGVNALAIAPTNPITLYAGTGSGLFKSTDGGDTWSTTGFSSTGAIVVDPIMPATLYAASAGVFKSTDGGSTWSATGLTTPNVSVLAIDPSSSNTLYAGTQGCVGGSCCDGCVGGVFKSTDGGGTWNASGLTEARVAVLAIDPTTSTTLYAGALGGGVFKSTDGGGTWSATGLRPNADVNALAIDPATPATVYAGTSWAGGMLKSTDGGSSWLAINTGLPADHLPVFTVAIDPTTPTTLYGGTSVGVFKSTDRGGTWRAFDAGLTNANVEALAIDPTTPSTLYAGTDAGVFGVSKSTDGGSTWVAANTGLEDGSLGDYPPAVLALAIDPATSTTLYAGTSNGVFKSTDGAGTWRNVLLGRTGWEFTSVPVLAIDPTIPTTIYAGASLALYKSTDGGDTWRGEGRGLPVFPVNAVAIDPTTPTTLYAGTWFGVYKSSDGGDNWSATGLVSPDPSEDPRYALAVDPKTPTMLYAGTIDPGRGVLKSTDGGSTWSTLNTGLSNLSLRINTLAIDPMTPNRLYAGTDYGGVFAIDQVSACAGDCAVDGRVTINEIITMINIALGTGSMPECGSGDTNHDNQVSIDEILAAVNAALYGCPTPPMPTPRFLTEDATLYDYWPCFSPDGRSLLFSRTADGVHWELRQVPVAGGPSISFASTPLPVSATRTNWSPSGDRIAFTGVSANGLAALWLISPTGTDAHRVTVGGLSGLVFYPSFYPDGNRLAITDLGAGGFNGGVVRTVDLAQATVTSLTNHSEILAGMPAVSPDGQRVAFAGQRNVGQTYDETQNSIFMIEPSGTVTQPDAGLGRTPAWSPDGEWIAFESSRASPEGRYAVFVMRPDGSGLRQLTDVSLDANHPVFSPDGKLLAFSASQPGWPITARGIAVIDLPDL